MPVLTECGAAELAYQAAVNPTFPGWGYWFVGLDGTKGTGGETIIVDTFWEAWYEGARSHNHAFRGTIDDWLYQYLAGIQATSPGYGTAKIQPYLVGDIRHAEASILTPLGELSSAWKRSENGFELSVQVPVGATAEVYVPAGSGDEVLQEGGAEPIAGKDGYVGFKVSSGQYRFTRGI
jgi:alpha-L-rhamnosidase